MRKSKKALVMNLKNIIIVMVIIVLVTGGLYPIARRTFGSIMGLLGMGLSEEEQNSPVDEADFSAEIEFEEDDWTGTDNVYFQFRNGEWEWRMPENDNYKNFRSVDADAADIDDPISRRIVIDLRASKTDKANGISIIEQSINADDGDGYLKIHYTSGRCYYETKEVGTQQISNLYGLAENPNNPPENYENRRDYSDYVC